MIRKFKLILILLLLIPLKSHALSVQNKQQMYIAAIKTQNSIWVQTKLNLTASVPLIN